MRVKMDKDAKLGFHILIIALFYIFISKANHVIFQLKYT
jgi:hypothetical protein